MLKPRSTFVSIQGSRRHLLTWGDDALPTVVLVHGQLDHAHNWDWIANHLAERFHVIAPDLRGHGDSDWTGPATYTLANHVLDLADIFEALNLSDARLIGHSLGGHIALRFTATFPDKIRLLGAIESVELPIVREQRKDPIPYPSRLRQWIEVERNNRRRAGKGFANPAEAAERMALHNPSIDAETIAHLTRHGLIALDDGHWRWKYDHACRLRPPDDPHGVDLDEILKAVSCPTLLAYGEDSWIPVPPAERLALIRNHRLARFSGASHWLHHQVRDAFLSVLTDFLETPIESP